MNNIFSLPGIEYYPIFLLITFVLITAKTILQTPQRPLFNVSGRSQILPCVLLSLVMIPIFGNRPWNALFPDTSVYANAFINAQAIADAGRSKGEYLWDLMRLFFYDLGMTVEEYFMVICTLYLGTMLIFIRMMFKGNEYLVFLFCITSFVFFSGATALIRNGLACNVAILSICFFTKTFRMHNICAILSMIIAYFIHKATLMPSLAILASYHIIKHSQWAILIWVLAIAISLIVGPTIGVLAADLFPADERLASFVEDGLNADNLKGFSHVGFRWDFLIYSATGVYMIYYVTIKYKIQDRIYNLLANSYILTNAMWIILIYAKWSDRFARLSWILLPFVLIYPLINFDFWKNKNFTTTAILYGQWSFLILMDIGMILYYYFEVL